MTYPKLQTRKSLVITLFAFAHMIALIGFAILADLTQLIIQVPRSVTMTVWEFRSEAMIGGLPAFSTAVIFSFRHRILSKTTLAINVIFFVSLFYSGYLNIPYFMFKTQQDTAKYISPEAAEKYLSPDEEVMVVEVNGDARAFPHDWLAQPHVAGDMIGGEDLVLVYYPEFDTVAGFSRKLGDRTLTVTEIDVQGNTPSGKLNRIPVDSEVLWMIWSNFYPGTDLMQ